ncbi:MULTISPECIES: rhodanese-like domain-containing protein [unclassified Pseudoalteromonas]|uniref:rhodanese-like domain-containing protein n=1 Tax=unclassified Pseudoalteromonas TaxID=194690 RepID=UPI00209849F7|nr:rhodanese-like domain-containing protein [Pseudoalteromonas sp. XMcav2-N]MCO7186835.1 rhodanese-like domain-containing protein [Pseudoalteromonas sp. XMcav2-N]
MIKKGLFLLFGLVSLFAQAATEIISQQALLRNQMSAQPHVIVDVRSEKEFEAGHLKGAINIPFDQITQHQSLLETLKSQTLVVYCRSGRRAAIFEQALTEQGFSLLHLSGDYLSWQAEQLPVITQTESAGQ